MELNPRQAKQLCDDILNQDVKKFGKFGIGKYNVYISNKVSLTNVDRVNKHYKLNPEKLTERYKRDNILYHKNKKEGICVKCKTCKAVDNKVMCKKCNDKHLEGEKKRRLKNEQKSI